MDAGSLTNTQSAKKEKPPFAKRLLSVCGKHKTVTVLSALGILAVLVYIISRFSTPFAEFAARYPGQAMRWALAKLTTLLPFSLAETLVLLLPVLFASLFAIASSVSKKTGASKFAVIIRTQISILLIIAITFGIGFGPCYFRNTLAQNLGLEDKPVSGQALYDTAMWLTDNINGLLPEILYGEGGESHLRVSFYELSDMVNEAFEKYASGAGYISHFYSAVKPVSLSRYMTYTHISGVYAFFTGEANVNFNYPDFVVPYTMAHEMSHQRGIAREDEANFVAFLVCISSDDAYIRYSGYVNVLREVRNALYNSDRDLYNEYMKRYPAKVRAEMAAYSKFFEPYRESTAAKVVSATNDKYLKSQSVKAGERSYGLVTDLAVAYYLKYIANQ